MHKMMITILQLLKFHGRNNYVLGNKTQRMPNKKNCS